MAGEPVRPDCEIVTWPEYDPAVKPATFAWTNTDKELAVLPALAVESVSQLTLAEAVGFKATVDDPLSVTEIDCAGGLVPCTAQKERLLGETTRLCAAHRGVIVEISATQR